MSVRKPRRNRPPALQPRPTDQVPTHELQELHDPQVVRSASAFWKGPLPPPAALEAFRQIEPTAPERIIRQWEQESDHRRNYETNALAAATRRGEIGLRNAIWFALAALAVAVVALFLHEPWVAGTIGGGTIVSVVGAFVYQRRTAGTPFNAERAEQKTTPARR